MPTISGKDGKVNRNTTSLAEITSWRLTTTADNVSYASSDTAGFRKQIAGSKHGLGTFSFELDTDNPLTDEFDEGDLVTLDLHIDSNRYYTVPAVIDSIIFAVDISNGDIVGGTADFSTNGEWTKPTFAN